MLPSLTNRQPQPAPELLSLRISCQQQVIARGIHPRQKSTYHGLSTRYAEVDWWAGCVAANAAYVVRGYEGFSIRHVRAGQSRKRALLRY
jgi:hypothetical protein